MNAGKLAQKSDHAREM